MLVKGKRYKTLWLEKETVKIIDQTKLPFRFKIIKLQSLNDFCEAIFNMKVRGAPLIGVTGAFGMAVSMSKDPSDSNINKSYELFVFFIMLKVVKLSSQNEFYCFRSRALFTQVFVLFCVVFVLCCSNCLHNSHVAASFPIILKQNRKQIYNNQ